MAETSEALPIDGTDEKSGGSSPEVCSEKKRGGSSPEDWAEEASKILAEKDLISDLPDSLIQYIISFLPSTKQAIQTGILSKRWRNQWRYVPILIFKAGKNDENFFELVDSTLTMHDCSKLKKFHFDCYDFLENDSQLTPKIRFATSKHVEELILNICPTVYADLYTLPEFLFSNDSLVKLEVYSCYFHHEGRPNWPSLKKLKLECYYLHSGVKYLENIVSGCPLLESFEISESCFLDNDVIAFKSLKRLVLIDSSKDRDHDRVEISCPNLKELSIRMTEWGPDIFVLPVEISCANLEVLSINICENSGLDFSSLPYQKIENVLSRCPLLHTLELVNVNCPERLVIASKSLRKLVLGELPRTSDVEILCPNLEESNVYGFKAVSESLEIKILGQIQHVKVLEIGSSFLMLLSALEVEVQSSLVLNCKWLTINVTNFDDLLPGIIFAFHNFPVLEKLLIKFLPFRGNRDLNIMDLWNSGRTVFSCSIPNLKTVKLVSLSEDDNKQKLVFHFVEFLLKNSRALENIVVTLANCGPGFVFEVSKKLLDFQRCYPHTTIELCSA